jgi:hypothetical protein
MECPPYIGKYFARVFVYAMLCRHLSLAWFADGIELTLNLIYEVILDVLILILLGEMYPDSAALFDTFFIAFQSC